MNKKRLILITSTQKSSLLSGLVAYWKLDESSDGSAPVTRVDTVGVSNLTDNNTCASGTGIVQNGVDLEYDNNEFLSVSSNSNLQAGDIPFTVAAWCKPESDSGGISSGLVSKWNEQASKREWALMHTFDRKLRFSVSPDGTNNTSINTTETTLNDTWYFVCGWHDPDLNKIYVQVNNGTIYSADHTTGIYVSDGDLCIGRIVNGLGNSIRFDGIIDECAIWKKVLTAKERAELYNAGNGKTHPF